MGFFRKVFRATKSDIRSDLKSDRMRSEKFESNKIKQLKKDKKDITNFKQVEYSQVGRNPKTQGYGIKKIRFY